MPPSPACRSGRRTNSGLGPTAKLLAAVSFHVTVAQSGNAPVVYRERALYGRSACGVTTSFRVGEENIGYCGGDGCLLRSEPATIKLGLFGVSAQSINGTTYQQRAGATAPVLPIPSKILRTTKIIVQNLGVLSCTQKRNGISHCQTPASQYVGVRHDGVGWLRSRVPEVDEQSLARGVRGHGGGV